MFLLLNPRVWIVLALVAILAFSHTFMYRKGKANVLLEWKAATAEANIEARKMEQRRQSAVDEAARLAARRQSAIAADSARSADALRGLRDAISARRVAEESQASAVKRADTLGILLLEGSEALREMALQCDRHVNDKQLLLDAWPK